MVFLCKSHDVMITIKDSDEEVGFNITNDGEELIFEITKEEATRLKEQLEKALNNLK